MAEHISPWMDEELFLFRDAIAKFFAAEMVPNEMRWQEQGHIDRNFWNKAGAMGILCASVPQEYGGVGGDFRHEAVILTEQFRASAITFTARSAPATSSIADLKTRSGVGCRKWPAAKW